jgi:hypothetical protein
MNNVSSLTFRTDFIAKLLAFHPPKRTRHSGTLENNLDNSCALDFGKYRSENSTKLYRNAEDVCCSSSAETADFGAEIAFAGQIDRTRRNQDACFCSGTVWPARVGAPNRKPWTMLQPAAWSSVT